MPSKILNYYLRKDVQSAILREVKDREVAVKFPHGYGKRPDVLLYENDISELAKQGATSFHISEERWLDPLSLKPGMSRKQLDDNRKGWDLVLDIDCKFVDYSKICASLLIEAINAHNVNNIAIKFSGGTGFHVGVPFEAFPDSIHDGTKLKDKFPEGLRIIADYLKGIIKKRLGEEILQLSTEEELSRTLAIPREKLRDKQGFNPYSVIGIDTVLISSRHLFRAPYSINEKTSLVSVPIKDSLKFRPSQAKIESVDTKLPFLSIKADANEAQHLIDSAFESVKKRSMLIIENESTEMPKRTFEIPAMAVKEEYFPPCIKLILKGLKEDGRKRAVFILINFLLQNGYSMDEIKNMLLEWNKRNYEPLREGYIISQLNWYKRQKELILPPNCNNQAYYVSIGVCKPDHHCQFIKNPVNYVRRRLRLLKDDRSIKKKN